jgi:hypothetical protein
MSERGGPRAGAYFIAQAGDSGPQANPELSPCTFDARTPLLKMSAALFERPANLGELSKRHQAWK